MGYLYGVRANTLAVGIVVLLACRFVSVQEERLQEGKVQAQTQEVFSTSLEQRTNVVAMSESTNNHAEMHDYSQFIYSRWYFAREVNLNSMGDVEGLGKVITYKSYAEQEDTVELRYKQRIVDSIQDKEHDTYTLDYVHYESAEKETVPYVASKLLSEFGVSLHVEDIKEQLNYINQDEELSIANTPNCTITRRDDSEVAVLPDEQEQDKTYIKVSCMNLAEEK